MVDFALICFREHGDALAYLAGLRELLGLLRRKGSCPQVALKAVGSADEFRAAIREPAGVQIVSAHAGADVFLSHDERERVPVDELAPGARAAMILDCCNGEAVLEHIADRVRPGVVVVAASASDQGHSLYPHDSMATFLPVLSEMAREWSAHGREAVRSHRIRIAVERAATAVTALREARSSSTDRPSLVARHDGDALGPGSTQFEPR